MYFFVLLIRSLTSSTISINIKNLRRNEGTPGIFRTWLTKMERFSQKKKIITKTQRGDPDKNVACDCRYFYSRRHKTPLWWNSTRCKGLMFKIVS